MRLVSGVSLLFAVTLLFPQSPNPEVFSPLGRPFHARPDEKRTVQAADLALAKGPYSADLLLAAAGARDALLRFSESIPLYTRGIDDFPGDVRFPRFRGHRFLSTRRFDPAIVDLKLAATLAPASFDVSYHLALAYYLRGDFSHAAREYQRCLAMAAEPRPAFLKGMPPNWRSCYALDDDSRVALVEWAWRALRRSARHAEAAKLLTAVHPKLNVVDNRSYLRTLLLYQGIRTEPETLQPPLDGNAEPTILYGVGLWHWLEGRKEQACAAWTRCVSGPNWAAFGFIAAEAELVRGLCKPAKTR
jgi:tetratricopeptide (TPR) repeat protein